MVSQNNLTFVAKQTNGGNMPNMSDSSKPTLTSGSGAASPSPPPQCQYFVVRKKRLCRMTVRPGRRHCGEHEPQPRPAAPGGQDDTRIPCPYDPKHTCYASRLEKHLSVCNARATAPPPYISHNVNAPAPPAGPPRAPRQPLAQLSKETIMRVVHKVNTLYETHVEGHIETMPELAAHGALAAELAARARGERSRRHLRQASALLLAAERERLVADNTCYVELGAGKGQLSYYMCEAWCGAGSGSRVLVVDRAALRHKRDNKLRAGAEPGRATRLRADLAHLALREVPAARACPAVVGFAKHLCGVATDYALRCLTADGAGGAGAGGARTRGALLATCCHHRCELAPYFGAAHLRELGITDEDFNVMLGIVSWATCGDGRSRESRGRDVGGGHPTNENVSGAQGQNIATVSDAKDQNSENISGSKDQNSENISGSKDQISENVSGSKDQHCDNISDSNEHNSQTEANSEERGGVLSLEGRAEAGRRAKALVDWGRVLALRARGLRARLARFVPAHVSPENMCIIATAHE